MALGGMQASHRAGGGGVPAYREISGRLAAVVWPRRNGCGENTTAGVDSTPAVYALATPSLRSHVGEVDEAGAAPVYERHGVPEPARATRPAGRVGLAPAGLQDFADRVGTGREAREDIVP